MRHGGSDDAGRAVTPGRVILLNGASSSGKTTLARELLRVSPEVHLHVALDTFLRQLPPPVLADAAALIQRLPRLMDGFHRSCAAIAHAGLPIIVDTLLEDPAWLPSCVRAFSGLEVLFVGVRCGLATLEVRERARGDRFPGTARCHYDSVHFHDLYDVEVDTEAAAPEACALRILAHRFDGTTPSAFTRIRER